MKYKLFLLKSAACTVQSSQSNIDQFFQFNSQFSQTSETFPNLVIRCGKGKDWFMNNFTYVAAQALNTF